jgi:glycosyltransferase involved in cell wall biosynthesis
VSQQLVILGPAHPLRPGGITTFNQRLCRAFADAGHNCSIWSFALQYPSFLFPGSSQFTDAPPPEGIQIHTLINSVNPFNWFRVGRMLAKERPDVVVVRYWIPFMGPCLGTILRLAKRNRHTRVVCIADNVIPHEHRPGDRLFTRYFTKAVDAFVVMSNQVLDDLRQFTQKPARLLPHPLYDNFGSPVTQPEARQFLTQKFRLHFEEGEKLLLFFGLVRAYKGLDLLIEAMAQLKHQGTRLLVAGEFYDDEKPYREQIARLGLQDRIIVLNRFIPDEEVRYFICSANCLVQPYKTATQSGVTPVGYHFEIPMIVTNVGGLPQMVPHGNSGLVCKPQADKIAEAIDQFLELPEGHFAPGIQSMKQQLSWDTIVAGLLEMATAQ